MDRPPEMAQTEDLMQYGAEPPDLSPDPPTEFVERLGDAAVRFLLHPEEVTEAATELAVSHGPVFAPVAALAAGGGLTLRYRRRRSIERRIAGEDASLSGLAALKLRPGQKASERNPAMPAVTVEKLSARKLLPALRSTSGRWTFPGGPVDEPHVAVLGRSGSGKNESVVDPATTNAVFFRPEPVVINDAKGAMFSKFGSRISRPQYVHTFDPRHGVSAAINLVQNRRMAEHTAAALYPLGGEKVRIYNRLARALFLLLVEHIGYERASLEAVYRLASDRDRLEDLAESDPGIASIVGGENRTLVGDVISSLIAPLEPLRDEHVARVFRSCPDQPDLRQKVVVWIVIPEGMEEVLGPLAGALLRNLYERAKEAPNAVRFVVDEAGSCLAFDDLARYMNVGRGRGVYFALVLQDVSQLAAKIGLDNTRSALGSAGVHFWGPSNDPATTHYVSDLSGTTRVARARYERYGFRRAWEQFWSSSGAEHAWEYRDRAVIEPHHVNGLALGHWYRYAGDPMAIRLVVPAPMHEWIGDALPARARTRFGGIPPAVAEPDGLPEETESGRSDPEVPGGEDPPPWDPAPSPEPPGRDEYRQEPLPPPNGGARGVGRRCPSCERPVASGTARFCEDCGCRL
jgi:hypothetical protein